MYEKHSPRFASLVRSRAINVKDADFLIIGGDCSGMVLPWIRDSHVGLNVFRNHKMANHSSKLYPTSPDEDGRERICL